MLEQADEKCVADAYEVLGLEVGASKEDLEKRYALLIKKYRSIKLSEDEEEKVEGEKALKTVTDAYNSIIENELQAIRSNMQGTPNPVLKKIGVDEGKAKNIIYYYKYHFLLGVIGLLALGYFIYGFATNVKPDFNLTAIGSFYSQDTEPIKQTIKNNISSIKEPLVEVVTITGDVNFQQEYAMQMKAVTVIAAGDIDVFIMDKDNFDKYAAGSAFASLDKLVENMNIDKSRCYSAKTEDLAEEHIYGLEAGSSKLLQGIQSRTNQKIVAISARTKNYEKAVKLVEFLIK